MNQQTNPNETDEPNQEFNGLPGNLGQQITRQIEAQMEALTRQINEQMASISAMLDKAGLASETAEQILQQARESNERAASRAQEKMQWTQEKLKRKLEAARRREEYKAQMAERRAQTYGKHSWTFEWPAPSVVEPATEAASEDERLMILRMLEQKKISLQEAERLLDALEGRIQDGN